MVRLLAAAAVVSLAFAAPASAQDNNQKMETCKFGADSQKLTGAKRNTFIKNCMADRDDPRGPAPKKPAAKPAAAKPPAN
jgi:hypothetical protein